MEVGVDMKLLERVASSPVVLHAASPRRSCGESAVTSFGPSSVGPVEDAALDGPPSTLVFIEPRTRDGLAWRVVTPKRPRGSGLPLAAYPSKPPLPPGAPLAL